MTDNASMLPPYRIGHGYDVHQFGDGDFIILGGIKIPHHFGLVAHSDGDVLIHALCDAMLGSIAAGDIGQHFPDSDDKFKNISSSVLLEETNQLLLRNNFAIVNIDVSIVAQAPKIAPFIPAMRERLAAVLKISLEQINIKATTTEKLGFIGREEGIATHCIVMVCKNSN